MKLGDFAANFGSSDSANLAAGHSYSQSESVVIPNTGDFGRGEHSRCGRRQRHAG